MPCLQNRYEVRRQKPTYRVQTVDALAPTSNEVSLFVSHNRDTQAEEKGVAERPCGHALAPEPASSVLIEPHDHGQCVSNKLAKLVLVLIGVELTTEPRTKECGNKTQQKIEVWNSLCKQPCHNPQPGADANPATQALEACLMHNICSFPYADVDVLAGYRSIDYACNDDCRDSEAESDFGDDWAC